MQYDVAIVGGGPAGSTAGTLLKKYNPDLKVVIIEREEFPRDHVGESQLPPISAILNEMGVWDKVEAADFPIKIGATYKWGAHPELWDFEFLPANQFKDEPRPAKYEGQRQFTAFQVDRAIYDDILLKHAAEMGCEVRQPARVQKILNEKDRIEGFELDGGEVVTARYYIDGSGHSGIIRRAFNVSMDAPTTLQNIAIWDYWQNADWAIEIGVGGTRVQVISVGYGWIWFIPLGPTRTSVGLIVPAEYFRTCGMSKEDLYAKALGEDERIAGLMSKAVSENKLQATKDWSFLAERTVGENWFLIGESAGFADPILAAGMSMAHKAGQEVAYSILELDRGKLDPAWVRAEFNRRQVLRVQNHIRFADYWYTSNGQFKDLKDFTKKIAEDNGYEMTPQDAWAWLAQGGFISSVDSIGAGGFTLEQMKAMHGVMLDDTPSSVLAENNVFTLDITGASWSDLATYANGKILKSGSYRRGERELPLKGTIGIVVDMLQRSSKLPDILQMIAKLAETHKDDVDFMEDVVLAIPNVFEGLVADGWVKASYDPSLPLVPPPPRSTGVAWNQDANRLANR